MTKDDALGLSADLVKLDGIHAMIGSLPGESFDSSFASLPRN
jgi:hypothetical protein